MKQLINDNNFTQNKSALYFCQQDPRKIIVLCKTEYQGEFKSQLLRYKLLGFEIMYNENMKKNFDMILKKFNDETKNQKFAN